MSQSSLSLANFIDPQSAGVLIANMLEAWLTAEPALELTEEAFDEHQDHPGTVKLRFRGEIYKFAL